MRKVSVISHHILSPVAEGSCEAYLACMEGRSGVRLHEGTFGVREPFMAALFDREKIYGQAAGTGIEGYSFYETLSMLSIHKALEGSDIDPAAPDTAFILSTTKGNVELLGSGADVSLGASSSRIVSRFKPLCTPLTVSNACISGLNAMIQGMRMIRSGRARNVVVCGAESQGAFIVTGFQSLKALSPEPCRPFDANRCGLNLGEAAATVILSADEGPWEIVDGAIRNDANHISGPSRTAEGSFEALRHVLQTGLAPAMVCPHGTATLYNDAMEAVALGRAHLEKLPICSLKGIFGHTMGAA